MVAESNFWTENLDGLLDGSGRNPVRPSVESKPRSSSGAFSFSTGLATTIVIGNNTTTAPQELKAGHYHRQEDHDTCQSIVVFGKLSSSQPDKAVKP